MTGPAAARRGASIGRGPAAAVVERRLHFDAASIKVLARVPPRGSKTGDGPTMNELPARSRRLAALIETLDRPLLALAFLTMVLYLVDLRGLIGWGRSSYFVL